MVKGWEIELLPEAEPEGDVRVEFDHGPGCASWVVQLTQAQAAMLGAALLTCSSELQRRGYERNRERGQLLRSPEQLGAHRVS